MIGLFIPKLVSRFVEYREVEEEKEEEEEERKRRQRKRKRRKGRGRGRGRGGRRRGRGRGDSGTGFTTAQQEWRASPDLYSKANIRSAAGPRMRMQNTGRTIHYKKTLDLSCRMWPPQAASLKSCATKAAPPDFGKQHDDW